MLRSLCILALLPTIALAQEGAVFGPAAGDWEVTISGAGSNDQDFDSGSGALNASIGYFFTEELELALRQSMNIFADGDSGTAFSTRVAVDYHFDLDRLRPFVGASFGGAYGEDVNETFLAGLEGGVKWYALPKTFLFLMAEYQFFFDSSDEVDDSFDDGAWVYTAGIGFNF